MRDVMFDIPSNPKIEKCIITEETVRNNEQPTLIINETKNIEAKPVKKQRMKTSKKETA